jgi:hypothetical protein
MVLSAGLATFFSNHRTPLVFLLIVCTIAVIFRFTFIDLTPNSDYSSYIATAQVFAGLEAPEFPARILKPLAPALVALGAPYFGFRTSFIGEVALLYLAFALVFYFLAFTFLKDRRLALIATLFSILSYPLLRYGLDLYTETGALFFYVLALGLTFQYLETPARRTLVLASLIIGAGLLWKEYVVINGLILGIVLLFEAIPTREKIKNLLVLGVLSLGPSLLVQLWVYSAFGYTYLDWYRTGGVGGFATEYTLYNLTKSLAALLGLAWLLVPAGLTRWTLLTQTQRRFLTIAIPPTLIGFCWGFVSSRLFYVMAPSWILIATIGLSSLPRNIQNLLVAVVLIANILWLLVATHTL